MSSSTRDDHDLVSEGVHPPSTGEGGQTAAAAAAAAAERLKTYQKYYLRNTAGASRDGIVGVVGECPTLLEYFTHETPKFVRCLSQELEAILYSRDTKQPIDNEGTVFFVTSIVRSFTDDARKMIEEINRLKSIVDGRDESGAASKNIDPKDKMESADIRNVNRSLVSRQEKGEERTGRERPSTRFSQLNDPFHPAEMSRNNRYLRGRHERLREMLMGKGLDPNSLIERSDYLADPFHNPELLFNENERLEKENKLMEDTLLPQQESIDEEKKKETGTKLQQLKLAQMKQKSLEESEESGGESTPSLPLSGDSEDGPFFPTDSAPSGSASSGTAFPGSAPSGSSSFPVPPSFPSFSTGSGSSGPFSMQPLSHPIPKSVVPELARLTNQSAITPKDPQVPNLKIPPLSLTKETADQLGGITLHSTKKRQRESKGEQGSKGAGPDLKKLALEFTPGPSTGTTSAAAAAAAPSTSKGTVVKKEKKEKK